MNKTPKLRFKEFSGDWETGIISDYGYFYYGKSAPKWSITSNATIPCIRYGELYTTHNEIVKEIKTYTNISKENLKFSKGGEVLVPRVGEKPLEFSKCTYLPFKDIAIGEMISVYNTNQNPLFIVYYFRSKMKYQFAKMVEGGNVSNLYYSYLEKIHVNIPSKEEQEKIASFLSLIDDKISLQGEKVKVLKDYKKGMMQKIFSRELRFKDDDGKDYPEWEERRFKDFVKINQGLQIPISDRYTSNGENRYFYITNEFLKSNSDNKYYIENPSKSVICDESDILMTRTGNTGRVVTGVKGAFHNNFFKISYDKSKYNRMFLYYVLISYKIQKNVIRLAGTSTIPDLNHGDFYNIKVNLPIKKEQDKISKLLSNIDLKIEKEQEKLDALNQYKKGLLQQMFI